MAARFLPDLPCGAALETERLRLRPFRDTDLDGLAAMCADSECVYSVARAAWPARGRDRRA